MPFACFRNNKNTDTAMNENYARRALIAGLMIAVLAALPGCATKKPGEPLKVSSSAADEDSGPSDNNDPLEPLNRGIFQFNYVLDGVLLSPLAHIYLGVMPECAQKGVHNVLSNLASPVVALNSILQGDGDNLGRTVGRFIVNSTLGVAGIFDMATEVGIKKAHDKDFGQTMGVWGTGTGPYIMLPVIGPSDARDTLGLVADILSDPFTWILNTNATIAYETTKGIVKRADLLPLTNRVYRDSLDPYATFRSIYLQHRQKVVSDYRGADAALETEK